MHKSFCNECQSVEPYKVDRIDGSWECRSCGFPVGCVECGGTMDDGHDCNHAHGREEAAMPRPSSDTLEFRVRSTAAGFEVLSRDPQAGGLTDGWSLMTRAGTAAEIGEAITEEIEYQGLERMWVA